MDRTFKHSFPDWDKLALWNDLRARYFGLAPHAPGPETTLDPHG